MGSRAYWLCLIAKTHNNLFIIGGHITVIEMHVIMFGGWTAVHIKFQRLITHQLPK